MANQETIDRFLLEPIATNHLQCIQDDYHKGCNILKQLTPGTNEYKWVEAKIRRILQAIDK